MDIPGWIAYNQEKFARIQAKVDFPGVGFSQSGPQETTFMMSWSNSAGQFQKVITGRMAVVAQKPYMGPKGASAQVGFTDEEIVDGGENMTLADMEAVIDAWRAGRFYEKPKPVRS